MSRLTYLNKLQCSQTGNFNMKVKPLENLPVVATVLLLLLTSVAVEPSAETVRPSDEPDAAPGNDVELDAASAQPEPTEAVETQEENTATNASAAELEANFAEAISRGEVLIGMSMDDVVRSRGEPLRKEVIPPDAELWYFDDGEVAFSSGLVSYASLSAHSTKSDRTISSPSIVPPVDRAQPVEQMESDSVVPAPTVAVGDRYVYESFDPDRPQDSIRTQRTITSTGNGIVMSSLLLGKRGARPRRLIFDDEWSLVATRDADGDGHDYTPPLQYFDFPLKIGKTWSRVTTERSTETGKTRTHTATGRVIDWEEVRVPAGTFWGLKVVLKTELFDPAKGERVSSTDVSWYVPSVRRSVKSDVIGKGGRRRVIQLLDYRLTR